MEKRIIAVNSNCYHGYSIEQAIDGIRRAGFHYIELTATKGWTEHVFPDMPFERLLAIRDELEAAQIRPFAMSGHCNLMDPERIPDFVKNIRLAAFFGCDYIVSSIGEAHLKDNAVADFRTLEEAGNASPFSIEIEFTQAGPRDLAEIDRAVQDSADYLRAHGFEL